MVDKPKNRVSHITWNKEKCIIATAIIGLLFGVLALNDIKNFISIIFVIFIGVLLPQLFDITGVILNKILELQDITNPNRYKRTLEIYNIRLENFANHFYFFIAEILTEPKRKILLSRKDSTAKSTSLAFQNLLNDGQPDFIRILKDEKETFSDSSWNYFSAAQGELCDIYRILKSLPKELEFTYKRYPEFINLQSAFYQIKDTFTYNASSRACEAFTEAFLKDLIKFLNIQ